MTDVEIHRVKFFMCNSKQLFICSGKIKTIDKLNRSNTFSSTYVKRCTRFYK